MRSASAVVFLFGLMLAVPHPAFAQETGAMVPEDFVRAMLSGRGGEVTILPGELPGTIESAVRFPESARVLGSVVYVSSSSASAYAVDTELPDAIRAFFRAQLEADGWTASAAYRRTGFVADVPVAPVVFCSSDNRVITISATERQGGTLIGVGYSEASDMTPCQRREQQRQAQGAMRSSFQEMRDHMPVLRMPAGDVRRGGGGSGIGRESNASFIEIETELTAAEIADHVAADLAADGWEPDASTTGNIAVIRAWTRTFEDGFRALGQLIILSIEPGRYDVTFNMTKLSGR